MTTFVTMYHPALNNVRVQAPLEAEALYEAHGWVLDGGTAPPPADIYLTPALGDLRYAPLGSGGGGAAGAAALVPTTTKTAAYTAVVGDLAVMNVAGGATTLTLPTAPADKAQVGFLAVGATTATPLTVNRGGTDTLGTAAAASVTVPLSGEVTVYQYQAASTRWLPVGNVKPLTALDARYGDAGVSALVGNTGSATSVALKAAYVPRPGALTKTRVLVIGSSNAYGNLATTGNSWAGLLASALSATHTFVNIAIPGIAASYWITPDATTGRAPLEDGIVANQPHIVLASFTAQNSGGPQTAFLGYVAAAKSICDMYGVRFIGTTPYISNAYTATQRDQNQRCVTALKTRVLPLLNFSAVWGTAATIPAAIDSGDGLHLNDVGHLEQFRQIPLDYLKLTTTVDVVPRFANVQMGLTVPSTLSTGNPASTNGFPAGSFTVGFHVKLPAAEYTPAVLIAFSDGTRVRMTAGKLLDCAGGIVHPAQPAWTDASEHHVALSYNAITKESVLYVDGVAVSTVTGGSALSFTGLWLGVNNANGFHARGYRFRNLTVHATVLQVGDVARLAQGGTVPVVSLALAASLEDAPAAPSGAILANQFGESIVLTTSAALA